MKMASQYVPAMIQATGALRMSAIRFSRGNHLRMKRDFQLCRWRGDLHRNDLFGKSSIVGGSIGGGFVLDDVLPEAGAFRELDVTPDFGLEDGRIRPGEVFVLGLFDKSVQLLDNFGAELGLAIKKSQNNPCDLQPGVHAPADKLHGFQ